MQNVINQNLIANFSITAHPTNPFSLEYTKLGNRFDQLFLAQQNSKKTIKNLIKKMILTKFSFAKKSPLQEMQESELAIKNIMIAEENLVKKLPKIMAKSYYKNSISAPKNICQIAVWTHGGDGDGNPNITAKIGRASCRERV